MVPLAVTAIAGCTGTMTLLLIRRIALSPWFFGEKDLMIPLCKKKPLKVERHRKCRCISKAIKQPCDLREVADDNGHTLLAYLINMAEVEARYVADEHRKHLKN